MRRTQVFMTALLVFAVAASLGMGDLGGSSGEKTPRAPQHNFSGTVTDRSMNTLAVTHLHCEGKTSIKGYLGDIRIRLDFEKIERVSFAKGEGGFTFGTVTLRDGQTKNMKFKNLTRCYGETQLGHMMVRVKDLRDILFNEPPLTEEAGE